MRGLSLVLTVVALAAALAGGCAKDEGVTVAEKGATCNEAGGGAPCPGTCGEKPCAEHPSAAAETGLDVGMVPPSFSLKDLSGRDVSLDDFAGKVVILDLWATWCGPCRQEIPLLVSLYEEFEDRGLVVVGVGLDQGGADALGPFAESNRMSYPVLVGNQAVAKTYEVTAIPSTFIIGRDGRIVSKHVGFDPSVASELRADIEKLVSGAGQEA